MSDTINKIEIRLIQLVRVDDVPRPYAMAHYSDGGSLIISEKDALRLSEQYGIEYKGV